MSDVPAVGGLRVVGMAPGEPFAYETFSGISLHFFTALRRSGLRVDAVDGSPPGAFDALAKLTTVHPRRSRWRERYQLSRLGREAASLAGARRVAAVDPRPDVLLQIGAWYRATASRRLRPRLRSSYHDGNLAVYLRRPDSLLDRRSRQVRRMLEFERRVYDSVDLILPMSEWLRSSFIEDFGQDPAKVVAVGAGANFEHLPAAPADRDFGRMRVLFVGKDFRRKGGPELLAAFRVLRGERPDAELWIVGPPTPPPEQEGVRWFPPISRASRSGSAELSRLYEQATLFAMPSRFEPFGIVFLEAMAHGLPCVAADTCAMPEIVEAGVTGFLAPPGDPGALAERLLEAARSPERLAAMGAAARRRFLERHTWDHVGGRVARLFVQRLAEGL